MISAVDEDGRVGWLSAGCDEALGDWFRLCSKALSGGFLEVALGTLLATLLALRGIGRVDHALLLWPVSGMAIGVLLPYWSGRRHTKGLLVLSAAAGFLGGALLAGMPGVLAMLLACFTCIDIWITTALLGPGVRGFDDLKQQRNILRFLAAVVGAPLVTGLLGAFPIALFLHLPVWGTAQLNVLANSLGIGIVTPAVLWARRGLLLRHPISMRGAVPAALAAALFLTAASGVFWQTTHPFLFLVFPPMIVVLLIMGLEGAVFTSIALAWVGWLGTSHGHGPILLYRQGSPLQHLLLLQGFCWVCLASALPIGALLDDRRRAERAVTEAQSIYQLLLQNAEDLIVLSSRDARSRYVSPAITRLVGWTPQEYLAMDRFDTLHPEDVAMARQVIQELTAEHPEQTLRYRMRHKDGSWKWVEAIVRVYGVVDGEIAGYVGTVRDISTLKAAEDTWRRERAHMANLADTDPLTGLVNRRGFDERLLHLRSRYAGRVALLMIDVDFFKKYNDTYGHQAGDTCLARLAGVLRAAAARKGDVVARLGGEEFAVVLPGASEAHGVALGNGIREQLESLAIEHSKSPFGSVTVSVGVACHPSATAADLNLLYAQADKALYVSKRSRNCVSAFAPTREFDRVEG